MRSLFLIFVGSAIGCAATFYGLSVQKDLAFRDVNLDGQISLSELLWKDIASNSIEVGGKSCTEIILLKDGLPVAVHCPSQ